jgi:hypothetical protein
MLNLFCTWLAGSFLFTGALFVGNAAFNNLGFPLTSTAFNWGRATLGTIPFVSYGAAYGPQGVQTGQAAGSVVFGLGAALMAFRLVGRIRPAAAGGSARNLASPNVPMPGTGTGGSALAAFVSRPRSH